MSLGIFQATIVDEFGNVQAGAEIQVFDESTGLLAELFSDKLGTALDNPFFTSSDGFAEFYANNGEYRISAVKGIFSRTWRYVQIGDTAQRDTGTDFDQVPLNTNIVYPVATVADLRLLTGISVGQKFQLDGHTNQGVGGGVLTATKLHTTETDNNGTLFIVDGVVVERENKPYYTLYDFGYTAGNAGSCANAAINARCPIILGYEDHEVDETILLKTDAVIIGLNQRKSRLIASSELAGNIIDTADFDSLVSNDIIDTEPDSGLVCPSGMRLENFSVQGNYDTYPGGAANVTQGNGMGVRVYGKQFYLNRLVIAETANCGLYTELSQSGTASSPFSFIDNNKLGSITDVAIFQTGKEGFIFKGPTDIWIDRVRCGVNANSKNVQGVLQDSVEVTDVGYGCHAISILRSAHFGFINGFNNANGRGVNLQRVAGDPGLRVDADYIQADVSFGNIYVDPATRGQVSKIETHGIAGDGSRPHLLDESALGLSCADYLVHREGNEQGSTGLELSGNINSKYNVRVLNDGVSSNYGHGVVLDGAAFDVTCNVSAQVGTAFDATDATGVMVKSTASKFTLNANSRLNSVNYDFQGTTGADLQSTINIQSRDAVITDIINPGRFGAASMRGNVNYISDEGGVISRNRVTKTVSVNASITTLQTFVIPHGMLVTPLESQVVATLSYDSGTFPEVVKPPYVVGANSTDITIQLLFSGGSAGAVTLNVLIN